LWIVGYLMIYKMPEAIFFRLCNDKSNIRDVSLITRRVRDEVLAKLKTKVLNL